LPAVTKRKKEKPLSKTPIPGTDWLRVTTNEGNTFYSHKVKKESVWTVPPEIREAVDALERIEQEQKQQELADAIAKEQAEAAKVEQERLMEIERVKNEVHELVKRKAEDAVPLDEVVISKKAKVRAGENEEDKEDAQESDDSEEEEWQREAAAQLAAEAEEKKLEEAEAAKMAAAAAAEAQKAKEAQQLNMPTRVDLSLDEAKALFKV
jgi:hypothetical protein